jgi:hypothetical protein
MDVVLVISLSIFVDGIFFLPALSLPVCSELHQIELR